ncbi:MAG: GTP-binding protein [Xanthobacteraceae bacterium]
MLVDTPGHEQYTRNMATGASNADLAVLLVDARKGLLDQTRRHAAIVSLLGIRHVVLAVNKIDLVGFDAAVFDAIAAAFRAVAEPLGFLSITAIPISARFGDNVATVSARTPWYGGPSLLAMLEAIDIGEVTQAKPFRFPVQWVQPRPDLDFRGVSGTIASGRIAVGDEVVTAASGRTTRVARIVTFDGDLRRGRGGRCGHAHFRRADRRCARRPSCRPQRAAGDDAALSRQSRLDGRRTLEHRTAPAAQDRQHHGVGGAAAHRASPRRDDLCAACGR